MTEIAAIAACTLLAALAVFQAALIAGAPIGRFAWGGKHEILPPKLRIGSAVSILLYALFSFVILARVEILGEFGSVAVVRVACWVLFGYFVLGTVMNGISRSAKERNTMAPVSLVLAVLVLVVALA